MGKITSLQRSLEMLTAKQRELFERKVYGNFKGRKNNVHHDIDFADYNTIRTKHKGNDIIMSGWMSSHYDHECGHDETWTFQVLAVRPDDRPILVHTLSDGTIVGNRVKEGCFYSFLYKSLHALVPEYLAFQIIDEQDWKVPEFVEWEAKRQELGYTEPSQMAWYFINSEQSDLIQSN